MAVTDAEITPWFASTLVFLGVTFLLAILSELYPAKSWSKLLRRDRGPGASLTGASPVACIKSFGGWVAWAGVVLLTPALALMVFDRILT